MAPVKKNYSIYVHALHSRLQLVRNKLDISKKMTPNDVITRNLRMFEKAGESVKIYHDHKCGKSEYYDAAELFLLSIDPDEAKILAQPVWKG